MTVTSRLWVLGVGKLSIPSRVPGLNGKIVALEMFFVVYIGTERSLS
jgi:hypothetical protein